MQNEFDVAVIGGGIVGLATAHALTQAYRCSLVILEQESGVAVHQTGRNSGVIHSGLYYRPGSFKARLCVEGRDRLYLFCDEHGIPFERCGKLIVAINDTEAHALDALAERGLANGLRGLKKLAPEAMREIEPHVGGVAGLWVPQTGIVRFAEVAGKLAQLLHEAGHEVRTGFRVRHVENVSGGLTLRSESGSVYVRCLINCGGLWSDRVARMCGARLPARIVPFRGEYYELRPYARDLVHTLIYPVPDPSFPFLGVHFTRTMDGRVLCGPNAVPALRRDGYGRAGFSVRDVGEMLAFSGTWRLALKHAPMAVSELRRSMSKRRFARSLQALVPPVRVEDLVPAASGVRAQAVDPMGKLVDDFVLIESDRAIHVLNAPSPAATASLSIGRHLAGLAGDRFGLSK